MKVIGNESANKLLEWSIQSDDLIDADADKYVLIVSVLAIFGVFVNFYFAIKLHLNVIEWNLVSLQMPLDEENF